MFKPIAALAVFAAISVGCSPANATPINPNDDIHCYGLATGYHQLSVAANVPRNVQLANAAMVAWYDTKFDAALQLRGRAAIQAEIAPLGQAVDADPAAAQKAYLACVNRAMEDPTFNAFAARQGF